MLFSWDLKIIQRITVLSVVGQHRFYTTLSDFLDIIGYWIGDFRAFAGIDAGERTNRWFFSRSMGVHDLH